MPSSTPRDDRFQREIDDIVRLAEKRLERQSFGARARRTTRRLGGALSGPSARLPRAETLAGWGLALLLLSWLLSLLRFIAPGTGVLGFALQVVGIALLAAGIIVSLTRGRGGSSEKMWRGERISYGSPYQGDLMRRLRRLFGGRRR